MSEKYKYERLLNRGFEKYADELRVEHRHPPEYSVGEWECENGHIGIVYIWGGCTSKKCVRNTNEYVCTNKDEIQ